jgi:hypothetical protein
MLSGDATAAAATVSPADPSEEEAEPLHHRHADAAPRREPPRARRNAVAWDMVIYETPPLLSVAVGVRAVRCV